MKTILVYLLLCFSLSVFSQNEVERLHMYLFFNYYMETEYDLLVSDAEIQGLCVGKAFKYTIVELLDSCIVETHYNTDGLPQLIKVSNYKFPMKHVQNAGKKLIDAKALTNQPYYFIFYISPKDLYINKVYKPISK